MHKYITITLMFILINVIPAETLSQEKGGKSIGLAVSPTTFEMDIQPGKQSFAKIRVYNPNLAAGIFRAELRDFWRKDDKDFIRPPGSIQTNQASKFIQINPPLRKISRGGTGDFIVTAKVPPTAQGGYIARIEVTAGSQADSPPQLQTEKAQQGTAPPQPYVTKQTVFFSTKVTSYAIIRIVGTEVFKVADEKIFIDTTTKPGIINLIYSGINQSNTFIQPSITAAIVNPKGTLVEKKQFVLWDKHSYAFPGEFFEIKTSFERPLPPGEYKVIVSLSSQEKYITTKEFPFSIPTGL